METQNIRRALLSTASIDHGFCRGEHVGALCAWMGGDDVMTQSEKMKEASELCARIAIDCAIASVEHVRVDRLNDLDFRKWKEFVIELLNANFDETFRRQTNGS